MLLTKLATQKKIVEQVDDREYRLVTASDDGYLFFWNISYDLITDAKNFQNTLLKGESRKSQKQNMKTV